MTARGALAPGAALFVLLACSSSDDTTPEKPHNLVTACSACDPAVVDVCQRGLTCGPTLGTNAPVCRLACAVDSDCAGAGSTCDPATKTCGCAAPACGTCSDALPCQLGLTCSDGAIANRPSEQRVCAPPCATDEDCGVGGHCDPDKLVCRCEFTP